jgi:hypothetical protein
MTSIAEDLAPQQNGVPAFGRDRPWWSAIDRDVLSSKSATGKNKKVAAEGRTSPPNPSPCGPGPPTRQLVSPIELLPNSPQPPGGRYFRWLFILYPRIFILHSNFAF